MWSGMKHMTFKPRFVVGMQSLSEMMLILAMTEPCLGCCVILAHAQPIKLLVCEFLYHLPPWQAFKSFYSSLLYTQLDFSSYRRRCSYNKSNDNSNRNYTTESICLLHLLYMIFAKVLISVLKHTSQVGNI